MMLWIGFTCNLDSDFMISIRNPFLVVVGGRRDCLDPKSKAKPKQILSLECLHMKLAMKWNLLFTFTVFQFVPS